MQSCLGIYVQKNLIKYAKVSEERNNPKIETYGVKFFEDDIEKTIEQIVKETYSFQVPISINIENEKYMYSDIFALMKPQDQEKAIDTEFEFLCNSNNQNRNTVEYRKIKTNSLDDRDKARIIYAYVDKATIAEKKLLLDKYKSDSIYPIATIIPNLIKDLQQEDCAIINIEKNTDITTIVNGEVYNVDRINIGMDKILELISLRENSIQRAYEICKNTTVYTKTGQNLNVDGNEYLDEIEETLLEIINEAKRIITDNQIDIKSIYITGMGLIINNIDLLFQEKFIEKKCEVLVPYFVEKTNVKVNIKDYMEVNSAISLAIQTLGTKKKQMNFSDKAKIFDNLKKILTSDIKNIKTIKETTQKVKPSFKEAIKMELDVWEQGLCRVAVAFMLTCILYIATSYVIENSLNDKIKQANITIEDSKVQISKVEKNTSLVREKTSEYQRIVDSIEQESLKVSESFSSRNAIPNFLNNVMQTIPTGVQILSIENTGGKNIKISAQAEKYDQLGYFKAVLEEEGILTNITTTQGVKQGELININISGQLAY